MSFLPKITEWNKSDPLNREVSGWALSPLAKKNPPAPPGVPNPNDAANAAQATTDQMRQRRGLLANIYAGGMNQQPVVGGKTSLGT